MERREGLLIHIFIRGTDKGEVVLLQKEAGTLRMGKVLAPEDEKVTSKPSLIPGFTAPDRSTPERTLRTFWWAIENGEKNIALACVDRKKIAEGYHGRDIDEFISEFSQLDTTDFRFIVSETRVSIQSPHHNMDYDMEKREDGKWVIVSIHP